jgi:hypothetical protein
MNSLIEEFYNGSKYKDILSLEQMTKICTQPFKTMFKHMNSDTTLPDFRFKYVGCFKVSKLKVESYKKTLKQKFEEGVLTEEEYKRKIKILESNGRK